MPIVVLGTCEGHETTFLAILKLKGRMDMDLNKNMDLSEKMCFLKAMSSYCTSPETTVPLPVGMCLHLFLCHLTENCFFFFCQTFGKYLGNYPLRRVI